MQHAPRCWMRLDAHTERVRAKPKNEQTNNQTNSRETERERTKFNRGSDHEQDSNPHPQEKKRTKKKNTISKHTHAHTHRHLAKHKYALTQPREKTPKMFSLKKEQKQRHTNDLQCTTSNKKSSVCISCLWQSKNNTRDREALKNGNKKENEARRR